MTNKAYQNMYNDFMTDFKTEQEPVLVGFYEDSATFEGVGRNINCFAFLSVAPTTKLRVHPFNLFEGADSKRNSSLTLYEQSILLRKLNGHHITINGIQRKIKVLVTSDYKALETIIGRQLGRPTSIGIHTTLTLQQASSQGHGGKPVDWESLKDQVKWKTKQDYIINNANTIIEKYETGNQTSDKNLMPFG